MVVHSNLKAEKPSRWVNVYSYERKINFSYRMRDCIYIYTIRFGNVWILDIYLLQKFALEYEWEIYQRPNPQQLTGIGVQTG